MYVISTQYFSRNFQKSDTSRMQHEAGRLSWYCQHLLVYLSSCRRMALLNSVYSTVLWNVTLHLQFRGNISYKFAYLYSSFHYIVVFTQRLRPKLVDLLCKSWKIYSILANEDPRNFWNSSHFMNIVPYLWIVTEPCAILTRLHIPERSKCIKLHILWTADAIISW